MLGSWSEHSTPLEQIKNIIDEQFTGERPHSKDAGTTAAKFRTRTAALIVTR
jgi:hypothetical protein